MNRPVAAALAALAALALLAATAAAELCPKCKGKMYITSVGKCAVCGGHTSSGAFKLCKKCSTRLAQCEHCRAPLKPAPKPDVVLGPDANGKTVAAKVGQTLAVRLPGNITTGYGWTVKKLDGNALEQVGKVDYKATKTPRPRVGSGGTFIATFKAVGAGKATLMMGYARPWEKDTPPIKTFQITVDVQAAKPKTGKTK